MKPAMSPEIARANSTPEGVPQQWSVVPPERLSNEFTAFYKAAVEAGYVEYPIGGPWGRQVHSSPDGERLGGDPMTGQCWHSGQRYEDDWSVTLRKGDVVINLVDRKISRRDGSVMVDQQRQGWFRGGQQAFGLDVPAVFDDEAIESIRRACNECKQLVDDESQLKHAGFAGRYCPTCYTVVKPRVEFKGWAN